MKKEIVKLEIPKIKAAKPEMECSNQKIYIQHALSSNRQGDKSISNQITKQTIKESKLDNYVIGKEIGRGAYAKVKLCQHKMTREKYAMKIYDRILLLDNAKKKYALKEIEILKILHHPNIVKFHEFIEEHENVIFTFYNHNIIVLFDNGRS